MAVLDWAVVFLVVYPLAQVPLVFYLGRRFTLDGDAPVTPTMAYWTGREAVVEAPPGRCRRCGADNDPDFTFCGHCAGRL